MYNIKSLKIVEAIQFIINSIKDNHDMCADQNTQHKNQYSKKYLFHCFIFQSSSKYIYFMSLSWNIVGITNQSLETCLTTPTAISKTSVLHLAIKKNYNIKIYSYNYII